MGVCVADLRNAERCQGWRMEAYRASRGKRQGEKARGTDTEEHDNATAWRSWILFLLRVFLCQVCMFSPFSRFCGFLHQIKNVGFKLLQGRRQVGVSWLTWAAAPPPPWSGITNWAGGMNLSLRWTYSITLLFHNFNTCNMFPNYFRKLALERQREECSWVDPLLISRTVVYISDPFQVVETAV